MTDPRLLAEAVRAVCIRAALDAYEEGGVLGLCAEGLGNTPFPRCGDCRSTHSSRLQRLDPLLNRIVKGMMAAEPDSFPVDRHNRKVARSWMKEGTGRVKRLVFKRL